MRYEELVDVYLRYRDVYNKLPDVRKKLLKDSANKVFTYKSYKGPIARFLADTSNGFEIYNCVYCDLTDARVLVNGKRQFVTEHILDKGECPLVGLSLYNFCPSCYVCNTVCKHSQPIGKNGPQMKKLGPSSNQYDFEHQVKFVLKERPEALGRIKYDHPDWYDLEFEYKDNDYEEVVKLFDLIPRYNQNNNKIRALEWRALAKKSRGIALAFTAWVHGTPIEEEMEKVFHYNELKQAHTPMLKLMKDMMVI